MPQQAAILANSKTNPVLNLGETKLVHLIPSEKTGGAFSVVEFFAEPGKGVGLHVHEHEEELVYLLQGQIEVSLEGQKMTATEGTCALLPRNIPHGFTNTGKTTVRLLAILLPGKLDNFFVKLDEELSVNRDHEKIIGELCAKFGLSFPKA
jgi:quercetin dioxygenase-like cupin family protein